MEQTWREAYQKVQEMIKVSVLVAVYNSEAFLPECLDSLLAQTLHDIEVICVDDASTDGSLDVLNRYAEKDSRIKVIHLSQNGGQAHARNVALKEAHGEYVCFLDSDDWFAPDSLKLCSDVFEKYPDTDSVLFRLMMYYDENNCNEYTMEKFEKLTGREAFLKSLNWDIHGVYMIRADLHKKYPYDDTEKAYSDDNTSRIHYIASRNVRYSDAPYYYRQHQSSVTHAVSPLRFYYMKANESMKRQLIALGEGKDIIDKYENIRWLVLIDTYMFYYINRSRLGKEAAEAGLKEMRRIWSGIDYSVLDNRASKFGYRPFANHWFLFRLQEELYFTIRGILGKNEDK